MPLHPHLPHVLYSLAITSLSIHLIVHRRQVTEQKARINAQLSLLSSIADKLQQPGFVDEQELDRLMRLKESAETTASEAVDRSRSTLGKTSDALGVEISWKDMVLGRKDIPRTEEDELAEVLKQLSKSPS